MFLANYLKSRLKRGMSLVALGPNEARILYDIAVGFIALLCTAGFLTIFMNQSIGALLILAPIALIIMNTALGIYSRLKTSSGKTKASVLLLSLLLICGVFFLLTGDKVSIVLWGMLTGPSLIIPRLLLSLTISKHKNIGTTIIKQRGPVLVIGGAGYIGTHLVDLLLKDGQAVRVLDTLLYGREPLSDFENDRNFELIIGDATDVSKLTTAMNGASSVVHFGGLVGDPACAVDQNFTRQMNIIATRMAKEVAISLGVQRFIFASSCSVYGISEKEVKEDDELNPVSLYAHTKIDSEIELLHNVPDNFFVTILRFATVFGHSRRPRFDLVANLFTAQAMTDGLITVIGPDQWRPFIHTRDLARATMIVLKAKLGIVQSQVFNVGDKRLNMTILQVGEIVKSIVEKQGKKIDMSIEEKMQDRRNYAVSFNKIKSMLGFEAEILMEDGILEIIDNFQKGKYKHYKEQIYSNVAMTKHAALLFQDPMQAVKLYAPLGEIMGMKK